MGFVYRAARVRPPEPRTEENGLAILVPLATGAMAWSTVGTLVISRRPANLVGWVLWAMGLLQRRGAGDRPVRQLRAAGAQGSMARRRTAGVGLLLDLGPHNRANDLSDPPVSKRKVALAALAPRRVARRRRDRRWGQRPKPWCPVPSTGSNPSVTRSGSRAPGAHCTSSRPSRRPLRRSCSWSPWPPCSRGCSARAAKSASRSSGWLTPQPCWRRRSS
jgi:hypothetical protein